MKKNCFTNFILCGLAGWCMECLWTGLSSIQKHDDPKYPCCTSIWMFPIYGMAAIIGPISRILKGVPIIIRGSIYAIGILLTEFVTGTLLKKHHCCPWDYSKSKYHYKGVIRFDYFPVWFFVGLIFERITNCEKTE